MKKLLKVKSIFVALAVVLGLLCVPLTAIAAETNTGSISVHYPIANANVLLYRVADYNGDDTYSLTGQFADYPVDVASEAAATTLENYVQADGIKPDAKATANAKGDVVFDDLKTGAYLVIGECVETDDDYLYYPVPTLLSLPHWVDGQPTWSVDVNGKTEKVEKPSELSLSLLIAPDISFTPDVEEDDDSDTFPTEIDVDVYHSDGLYEKADEAPEEDYYTTVTVKESEDWQADIEEVPYGGDWAIKPEVPDGYTVSVSKERTEDDIHFKVVYTHVKEGTDGTTEHHTQTLPRTGQNWTLVSGLAGAGLVFLLVGAIRYKRSEDEEA